MPQKDYYEVPLGAYLFERPESEEAIKPEERVRQWCAHELIRAYGYNITDLTFEHPVKVGSKNYRIDILIMRDDKPFIVIECKKADYKRHEHGMEQAISYANAQRIKADYAVYTNGSEWLVKRCINGRWAPAIDIPTQATIDYEYTVDHLYNDLNDAAPLLHRLTGQLTPKESHRYFEAMQRFFHGENLLTESGSDELLSGLDHILRCILHIQDVDDYMRGKFLVAFSSIKKYAESIGLKWRFWAPMEDENPFWQTGLYQLDILEFLEDTRCEAVGIDYYLLELIAALFGYCHELRNGNKKQYPALTSDLQEATRNLLNYGFKHKLLYRVPPRSDKLIHQDIKNACAYGWDDSNFSHSN